MQFSSHSTSLIRSTVGCNAIIYLCLCVLSSSSVLTWLNSVVRSCLRYFLAYHSEGSWRDEEYPVLSAAGNDQESCLKGRRRLVTCYAISSSDCRNAIGLYQLKGCRTKEFFLTWIAGPDYQESDLSRALFSVKKT